MRSSEYKRSSIKKSEKESAGEIQFKVDIYCQVQMILKFKLPYKIIDWTNEPSLLRQVKLTAQLTFVSFTGYSIGPI